MEAHTRSSASRVCPSRTIAADTTFRVVFDRVLSGYPTLDGERAAAAPVLTIRRQQRGHGCAGRGPRRCFEFPFMTEIAPAFTVEVRNVRDAAGDRRRWRQLHLAAAWTIVVTSNAATSA